MAVLRIAACVAAAVAAWGACAGTEQGDEPTQQEEAVGTAKSIEEAQAALTDSILGRAGIVGTGIGECDGDPCIKVFVVSLTEEARALIPGTFEGHKVAVEVTGEIRAQDDTAP